MIKKVRVINSEDSRSEDKKFWESKSPEEKLSVVQILREQYIYYFNKQDEYAESRNSIRKVYKVINRDLTINRNISLNY